MAAAIRPASALVLGLALCALTAPAPARAGIPALPVEQWSWHGPTESPTHPEPATTPIVLQLTDDNGDGLVDGRDAIDVAFLHFLELSVPWANAQLTVVDGATGAEHFTVSDPPFGATALVSGGPMLAAGDVDRDGLPEFIVSDGDTVLTLNHDGTLFGQRSWPGAVDAFRQSLSLADLNRDGVPEVLNYTTALSLDGSLSWTGTANVGQSNALAHGVNLHPGLPGLEVLVGNTLYSADGALVWQATVPEGATAVGDIDGDGDPEIALAAGDQLYLLDHAGAQLGSPIPLGVGTLDPAAPIFADLDADGVAEVVAIGVEHIVACEWFSRGLLQLWTAPTFDRGYCSLTAFDFDGDGADEVVYHDEVSLLFFEGRDGRLLHAEPFVSGTGMEKAVIANIDDDPWAEIVSAGFSFFGAHGQSIVAYEIPNSCTPRSIWNQHTYHVTNVNDDGTIPQFEQPPWIGPNSWGAQSGVGVAGFIGAEATDLSTCDLGVLITWDEAVWRDPLMGGTYNVYRSDEPLMPTCGDALSRPPVATGLVDTRWQDSATEANRSYAYVVEADDPLACGGLDRICLTPPTLDVAALGIPEGVFAVLRASHAGDDLDLSWSASRALLPGEHFHLLKAVGTPQGSFAMVNAESDTGRSWGETDATETYQFFDLRVANGCEEISPDEYPPGFDR